jgi:hypothetical protein
MTSGLAVRSRHLLRVLGLLHRRRTASGQTSNRSAARCGTDHYKILCATR